MLEELRAYFLDKGAEVIAMKFNQNFGKQIMLTVRLHIQNKQR